MTKSRRNNRFSNRKNLRSKCRKHNIQRGGEVKCVKALYTINPRKGFQLLNEKLIETNII